MYQKVLQCAVLALTCSSLPVWGGESGETHISVNPRLSAGGNPTMEIGVEQRYPINGFSLSFDFRRESSGVGFSLGLAKEFERLGLLVIVGVGPKFGLDLDTDKTIVSMQRFVLAKYEADRCRGFARYRRLLDGEGFDGELLCRRADSRRWYGAVVDDGVPGVAFDYEVKKLLGIPLGNGERAQWKLRVGFEIHFDESVVIRIEEDFVSDEALERAGKEIIEKVRKLLPRWRSGRGKKIPRD